MSENKKISTTALAKLLEMDSKALFELLIERKWMSREKQADGSNMNKLTGKGEFEGGEYLESKKYGTYIVWPTSLIEHSLFTKQSEKYLNTSYLAKVFSIPSRRLNVILAELGWIIKRVNGWKLTQLGRTLGGLEKQHEKSGLSHVVWPQSMENNDILYFTMQSLLGLNVPDTGSADYACLDGHSVSSKALLLIDNWLYSAGLLHAYKRELPVTGKLCCDFYLPNEKIYIEYWGHEKTPTYLKQKMAKKKAYQKQGFKFIDIEEKDLVNLDEVLSKALLAFSVQVY